MKIYPIKRLLSKNKGRVPIYLDSAQMMIIEKDGNVVTIDIQEPKFAVTCSLKVTEKLTAELIRNTYYKLMKVCDRIIL